MLLEEQGKETDAMSESQKRQCWLITGANGNLGRRLIGALLRDPLCSVVAVVRSERARLTVESELADAALRERLVIRVVNYTDVEAMRQAAAGCDKAVHLVGILKQTRRATYHDAHEASTSALLQALEGTQVEHLVYLSIVGAAPGSANACLASKGAAETLCLRHALPACVLRVPMVLGEGDFASFALRSRAQQPLSFTFRGDSMEQPIYAGDVVRAIRAASARSISGSIDLGGPESLSRRALTRRAAGVLGKPGRMVSLPLWLGLAIAAVLEATLANPPVTRAMLEVLDHDDEFDARAAVARLGLEQLTPLDEMLRAVLTN